MKRKAEIKTKKKWKYAAAAALCMAACLAGCGKREPEAQMPGMPAVGQGLVQENSQAPEPGSPEDGTPEGEGGREALPEPPEGYVYDFQVSMEPIPKEIADQGGDCVGTMHAFPSRIKAGLTKQLMEGYPATKEKAEQMVQGAKESLREETGKEFGVELMEMELMEASGDWIKWSFYCTEEDSNYHFCMDGTTFNLEPTYYPYYYTRMRTMEYGGEIKEILSRIYGNAPTFLWCDAGVKIYAAQFSDGEIDYMAEQAKLLELFQALEELPTYEAELPMIENQLGWIILYNDINIAYYPSEYEELITKKCREGCFEDVMASGYYKTQSELLNELIDRGEIRDVFIGKYSRYESSDFNYYSLLEDYRNGTYDETKKWDGWATGGEK